MTMVVTRPLTKWWITRPAPARAQLLVHAVAGAAVGVLAFAMASVLRDRSQLDAAFVLIALTTLCTDALSVELRVGRHVESFTWAEFNVVLGLALLTPAALVLTSLSVATAYTVTGREPLKVIYNTGSYVVGVTLALFARILMVPSWNRPLQSICALVLGGVIFSAWNSVSIDAVIAFSQNRPFRQVHRKGLTLRWAVCAGNILLALVVLWAARHNPVLLVGLPLSLAAAYTVYRSGLRTIQERAIWRDLEATSMEIHRLDERAVINVALARAKSLFDAEDVRLLLSNRDRSSIPELDDCFAVQHLEGHTLVKVPLLGRHDPIGALELRFDTRVKLTERERRLMRTFAHTITTSIENARLYAEMAAQAARSESQARHDPLTGLPNRVMLSERVTELVEREPIPEFALMLLDLDHFKDVNDGLGHSVGDTVLQKIASRLKRAVRADDVVCRLGGDEFAILVADASAASAVAQRLLTTLDRSIEINGMSMEIGGSIGCAIAPEDGISFEELLRHADVAMYQAKRRRGSFCRYTRERDNAVSSRIDRLSLVGELRRALRDDQFELHFQPQLDLASGVPIGAEALVRWRHPRRGLLGPNEFIGLLEMSNLVRDFTNRVLDMALAECATWQSDDRPFTVAVNLSARNVADERLADDVRNALLCHGVDPSLLVLEITETAMVHDLSLVEKQVARLANLGVALSIDDFGTGNSSLTFLQRVMVHELKIDRSFVAGIVDNENDAAITRATVRLAQSLGLRTVAEGVEDERVAQELRDLNCECAQGYYWSRPVPADDIRRLFAAASSARMETLTQ
jgi:diguanylate cyclase (GGDEF)-like protein